MAQYNLYVYDRSSFVQNGQWSGLFQNLPETNLGKEGQSFSTTGALSGVSAIIEDNNGSLHDDTGGLTGQSQTLAQPLTINGTTYPAGTRIEMGFVANVENSAGELGRFYSIKVGNDIVGLAVASPETYPLTVGGRSLETGLDPNDTYTVISANNGNRGGTTTAYTSFVCFARGTLIETTAGAVPIEELSTGDFVVTKDKGAQPIKWIGSKKISAKELEDNEKIRPIRINRHALGADIPSSDLIVSPQHRVLVRSKIAQKMFGADEILVAAKQLCQMDGINIAYDLYELEYFHFMFDHHEVVISNGAETESLYTGPEAIKSVGPQAAEEIFALFPQLKNLDYTPSAARVLASGRMGRKLAVRHQQNQKPLVS